jgi:uncharacterized membrane protein
MQSLTLPELYACVGQRWAPVIGDPTVMGWLTVVAYAAAALACLAAGRLRIRDSRFWLCLAVLLALLCVNKQLDLQSALTATGRCISQMQGWYEQRRMVQVPFVIGLMILGITTLVTTAIVMAPALFRVGVALLGFGLLLTFVAVRAIGLTHVDQLINLTLSGVRMNWVMELSGIVLIAINALAAVLGRRRSQLRRRSRRRNTPRFPDEDDSLVFSRSHR